MEPLAIIGGVIAAAGAGLGIGVGVRLLPIALRAHRGLRAWRYSEGEEHRLRVSEHEEERLRLARPPGRKRETSVAGLCDAALRHTDGSYTCAWEAQPAPTMLSHDHIVEARCDELARMLAVDKPPGTVIQFRFSSGPDPGKAIIAHLSACGDPSLLHLEAARLHAMNVDFYGMAAAARSYRRQALSLWARVPVRQKADDTNNGLSAFISVALDEMRKHGVTKLHQTIRAIWAETVDDGVVRRLLRDEGEARESAEKVFRLVERECPLPLRRLSQAELWEAVYLGHRQNAQSVPILPNIPGLDIRDYLCGETLEGSGQYVMHGAHPAAIVSMFTPPQPIVTADALRALTLNPALNFRHTIIAEFVYLDQRKATKRLDRRIRQLRRSHIRADGRVKQSPEARAALLDLETVRDHGAGSRESLIDLRFYAIVYAEPARTRGELKQSLDNLDRYCERMVTAMQSIPGVEAAREEPDSLRALYHQAIVGEADKRPVGREVTEVAGSLAAPVMIALAIDRNLANKISYPFLWGTIVLTLVWPVVSQLIRAFAYMGGNLAMSLDASDVVYQWDPQTMGEIMTSGAEPFYTVIIAIVIMTIAGLSLWMSPVIAYKVAMGQVYESVSSTISGWAGALVGAGIELYSSAIAASISNQAERAQAQGQFMGELTRAGTAYDVGKLNALANRIRSITGIEGTRVSSVEGIYGGLTRATGAIGAEMQYGNETAAALARLNTNDIWTRNQQAVVDLNADRKQQSANIETNRAADTEHFIGGKIIKGTEWTGGAARTLLSDAQSGKQTLAGRAAGSVIEIGGGIVGLGMQYRSIQNRAAGQQSALNEAIDTRISNQERASRHLAQNQEIYRGEIVGANQRRAQGLTVAEIAGANQAIAGANRGAAIAKGGVNQGYQLDLQANRINYDGAVKAATQVRDASFEAARLRALSTVVSSVGHNIARDLEQGLALRY